MCTRLIGTIAPLDNGFVFSDNMLQIKSLAEKGQVMSGIFVE